MTTTSDPTTSPAVAPVPAPSRRARWVRRGIAAVVGLAVAAACVYVYVWANVQTYHADVVQSTVLYRSGNRDLRELRHTVEPNHIRTIVSLVSDAEVADPAKPQFRQEADYCRDHGIQLVRIPVKLGGWPTADQIKQFLGVVALPENRPVLVHCAQGVRRTGMFVAAFQLSVQDRSKDATRAAVQTFGHKPRDTDDVQTFIDNYDPAGNLPTTMPAAVSGD